MCRGGLEASDDLGNAVFRDMKVFGSEVIPYVPKTVRHHNVELNQMRGDVKRVIVGWGSSNMICFLRQTSDVSSGQQKYANSGRGVFKSGHGSNQSEPIFIVTTALDCTCRLSVERLC
jgi:hypothetical protein